MLKKAFSISFYLAFALYLTPVGSAHFCHWFTQGEHHGSCEHHPIPLLEHSEQKNLKQGM